MLYFNRVGKTGESDNERVYYYRSDRDNNHHRIDLVCSSMLLNQAILARQLAVYDKLIRKAQQAIKESKAIVTCEKKR